MIKILYFASYRERLETSGESMELTDKLTNIDSLCTLLSARESLWSEVFSDKKRLMVSINQQMAKMDTEIKDNDEIAFFPPVTGG